VKQEVDVSAHAKQRGGGHYNRALQRTKLGNLDTAIDDCDNAIAVSERMERRLGRSVMHFQQVDLWARAILLRVRLKKKRGDVLNGLGADIDRVIEHRADLERNTEILALQVRADVAEDLEQFGAAEDALREVLTCRADLSESEVFSTEEGLRRVLWNGARAFSASDDDVAALNNYNKFLELTPDLTSDRVRALVNRSSVHLRMRRFDLCDQDCSAVLEGPDSPLDQMEKALLNRSQARLHMGDHMAAARDLDDLAPTISESSRASAMYVRALCLVAARQISSARITLAVLVEMDGVDPAVRTHAQRLLTAEDPDAGIPPQRGSL
jgi:tetratricopeptide (TPR) repeat protein